MKKLLQLSIAFIGLWVFTNCKVNAQGVGINSSGVPADPSAMIDVSSTTKGALIPRMTSIQRDAISSPAEGLQIFNTTTKCLQIYVNSLWQNMFCPCVPDAPTAGTHVSSAIQIIWNWNSISGASGYKYSTTNNYATATDNGTITSYMQTGLTCGSSYTLYIWAYNFCGNSASTTLTQTTSGCCSDGTGGNITHAGGYTIHTFTSPGSWTMPCGLTAEYLVVGGGGGGGNNGVIGVGGGGGGGGTLTGNFTTAAQTYTIAVGQGGTGASATSEGSDGGNSSITGVVTATGGGGGGGRNNTGRNGGSGGGGGQYTGSGATGISGQGNNGGHGGSSSGGGGGGAGTAGGDANGDTGGNGGNGLFSLISGSSIPYAGGGGGSGYFPNGGHEGAGGIGGGGHGGDDVSVSPTGGMPNTGGGGGGGIDGYSAGNGGSGIVIIRYPTPSNSFTCGSTLTITHTIGTVAPETKTVNYATVLSTLGGTGAKCWITQNLGSDNQAASPTDATDAAAGWYWQFNRKQGYKVGPTPSWTITSINENSDWLVANDPCTIELGVGWRIPTSAEWTNADATGGWNNYNNTYNSVLKLHAAGALSDSNGALVDRGVTGHHWSNSQATSLNAFILAFSDSNCFPDDGHKAYAWPLRCIKD